MRILITIFFIFFQGEVIAKDSKFKLKKTIEHNDYYENYGTLTKKSSVDGKNRKLTFELREFFPIETVKNEKEGRCRDYRIQEKSYNDIIIEKSYSLNDCLPCIDKGAGYMCSYPYFQVFFYYSEYGNFDNNFEFLREVKDVTQDGARYVVFTINIGSREQVRFIEVYPGLEGLGLGDIRFFRSQIYKFNTRLRKILSEKSKVKKTNDYKFELIFDRIKNNTLESIENKTKINLREKDLKILFMAEPSATVTKFQTRD